MIASAGAVPIAACRSCGESDLVEVVDLGSMPSANAYLLPGKAEEEEREFPLRAVLCVRCLLVQLDHAVDPGELFGTYSYFSSYSTSWLDHSRRFSGQVIERFGLTGESLVVELASNDGYLLRNFVERGIPALGVEPAENVAEAARSAGVETMVRFFGAGVAEEIVGQRGRADLVVGNNVLAHVPAINDFVGGIAALVGPEGVVSLEFPHLLRLLEEVQFDTIYHEHFSYLSLLAVQAALERHGMRVFDVEELGTHGGSLRVFACHRGAGHREQPSVARVLDREAGAGMDGQNGYAGFGERVRACRSSFLDFLSGARREGKVVVGYGAAAKGNTFLNFCGVGPAEIPFVVDRSPHKQGRLLPGSRIPVEAPEKVTAAKPDYVLILPWNLRDEIVEQMACLREWGGRFVTAVPTVRILP